MKYFPSLLAERRNFPHIRHGLLTLGEAWEHVNTAPDHDCDKFRDELLWQEYAAHVRPDRNATH